MRFFVPLDAQIRSVMLDGVDVPLRDSTNPVPPPAPYWVNEEQSDKRVVHIPFSVAPHAEKQLVLRWFRPNAVVFTDKGTYQFSLRKQPGVPTFPWSVVVEYPQTWGAVGESGVAKPGFFTYNTDLTKDTVFKMLFRKNL